MSLTDSLLLAIALGVWTPIAAGFLLLYLGRGFEFTVTHDEDDDDDDEYDEERCAGCGAPGGAHLREDCPVWLSERGTE